MPKKSNLMLFLAILLFSGSFRVYAQEQEEKQITVDGFSDDWVGIEPVHTDPEGDMEFASDPGSDIKAIYSVKDEKYLYIMIEFYGSANFSNYIDLYFNKKPEGPADHFMFNQKGFISWSKSWANEGVKVGYSTIGEISFPLELFKDVPIMYFAIHVFIPSIEKWDDNAGKWVNIWIDKRKGIHLEYNIKVKNYTSIIEIDAFLKNLQYYKNIKFVFPRHWVYTASQYVKNITFSADGNSLTYNKMDEETWSINLREDVEELHIHYFVNISFSPPEGNYLCSDFGIFYAGLLFICPEFILHQDAPTSIIKVHFEIPETWEIAVPWNKENNQYYLENTKYLTRGAITLGKFNVTEYNISNVLLIIAMPESTLLSPNIITENTINCFKYLTGFLQYPYSTNRFVVTFVPPTLGSGESYFSGPSIAITSGIHDYKDEEYREFGEDWWVLPHEMIHILDGYGGRGLEEGFTQYMCYKTNLVTGIWDVDDFYHWLNVHGAQSLQFYYTDIWNTSYNLPIISEELEEKVELRRLPEPIRPEDWWNYEFIWARKTSIVGYMLDVEIKKATNNSKSLNNVISHLNSKYLDPDHDVSPNEFLETVNFITENNFTRFFSKYIFGNDHLPPTPVEDWLNYYIDKAEELVYLLDTSIRTSLVSRIDGLREKRDHIINLIYAEKYDQAFDELEAAINSSKEFIEILSDKESPTIGDVSYTPSSPKVSEDVTVSISCWDEMAGVLNVTLCYSINHGPWLQQSMNEYEGEYISTIDRHGEGDPVEFYIEAFDEVGNEAQSNTYSYSLPSEPPSINKIRVKPSSPTPDEDVTVSASVTDDGSGVDKVILRYSMDGTTWPDLPMSMSDSTFTATIPRQPDATYVEYYIEASDKVGNKVNSTINSYTVKIQEATFFSNPVIIGSAIAAVILVIIIVMLKKRT